MMDDDLERCFCPNHQFYDRIFYDRKVGSYYDRGRDFYITLEEARTFGVR